jgi:hypothetical protein
VRSGGAQGCGGMAGFGASAGFAVAVGSIRGSSFVVCGGRAGTGLVGRAERWGHCASAPHCHAIAPRLTLLRVGAITQGPWLGLVPGC